MSHSSPLNTEWIEKFSTREQRVYYFNVRTAVSSWECPYKVSTTHLTVSNSNATSLSCSLDSQPYSTSSNSLQPSHTLPADAEPSNSAKRVRHQDEENSYAPPVSGSAVDAALLKSANLPPPIITTDLAPSNETMWDRQDIQVNKYLAATYKTGEILDSCGKMQKFKDITNPIQGRHIYNLIVQNNFAYTLEIGLAMGASASWICQAHKELRHSGNCHIAADPNQTAQYEGIGKILVERCGLKEFMTVMEMTSYRALPKLLEEVLSGRRPRFHLIYIDGWHTFDYTLVDFFYADLLLETNGVIVLDDVKHKPVQKCLKYIGTNYPHYKVVPRTPVYNASDVRVSSQATFIKTAPDTRVWNHHVEF